MPGLSGHMQNCHLASYYVPWMSLIQRNFDDAVKSDIRFKIDELFAANDIVISFPQRDVHLDGEVKIVRQ